MKSSSCFPAMRSLLGAALLLLVTSQISEARVSKSFVRGFLVGYAKGLEEGKQLVQVQPVFAPDHGHYGHPEPEPEHNYHHSHGHHDHHHHSHGHEEGAASVNSAQQPNSPAIIQHQPQVIPLPRSASLSASASSSPNSNLILDAKHAAVTSAITNAVKSKYKA